MRLVLRVFILLYSLHLYSQNENLDKKTGYVISPEILAGITAEANKNFPKHKFQKQLMINFAKEQNNNPQEWAQRLKGPRTGVGIGIADFGNPDSLGYAVSVMPLIEFNAFRKKNLKISVASGVSYFNKIFDSITNPKNQAVTTDLSWSLRIFMHYQFLSGKKLDWRIGAGYFHHSNGHTRLPNQGYNSFLVSLSADIKNASHDPEPKSPFRKEDLSKSSYHYVTFKAGAGVNVLARAFNDKKEVYSIAGEYGRVYNNTLKIGVGMFYRFYQHYYDYIVDNESLVQDGREFDYFKEDPWKNATNFGLSIHGEAILNHVGIDVQIGFNLHKPAYRIDWRLNQGWSYVPRVIPEESNIVLGEFDSNYKLKRLISTRSGLKYYLIGMNAAPKNNIYVGLYINSNLGQADYTELSVGYVHNFNFKKSN